MKNMQARRQEMLLRTNLRTILAHAPLTDARTYVHDVEAAYAEIWKRFVHT